MDLPAQVTSISKLTKAELLKELKKWEAHGATVDGKWSCEERRQHLKEMYARNPAQTQMSMAGWAGKKKEEIRAHLTALNIYHTENDVKGKLLLRLRAHLDQMASTSGQDTMTIGRHRGLTYQEIRTQHPDYVQWAVTTVEEEGGSSSPELKRFVRWTQTGDVIRLTKQEPATPSSAPKTPTAKAQSTARSSSEARPPQDIPVPQEEEMLTEMSPEARQRMEELEIQLRNLKQEHGIIQESATGRRRVLE